MSRATVNKSAAIRALLKGRTERNPILFADFHQAFEKRCQMVIGRTRLRSFVSMLKSTTDPQIRAIGRGDSVRYWWQQ